MRIIGRSTGWALCVLTVVLVGVRLAQSSELDDIYTRALQEEQRKKAEQDRPRILANALAEDVRKYQDIVNVTKDNPATRQDAWVALCKRWGVTPIPEKPAMLAWDPSTQRPQVVYKVKFYDIPIPAIAPGAWIKQYMLDSFSVNGQPVKVEDQGNMWVVWLPAGVQQINYQYEYAWSKVEQYGWNKGSTTSGGGKENASLRIEVRPDVVTFRHWKITRPGNFWHNEEGEWIVEYVDE